jgi:ribosomal protein S9
MRQSHGVSSITKNMMVQIGKDKFKDIDIRIRVRGGGNTSQVYAIRQAIAKGIVAYYRESGISDVVWVAFCAELLLGNVN